jgi:hypothetical protein
MPNGSVHRCEVANILTITQKVLRLQHQSAGGFVPDNSFSPKLKTAEELRTKDEFERSLAHSSIRPVVLGGRYVVSAIKFEGEETKTQRESTQPDVDDTTSRKRKRSLSSEASGQQKRLKGPPKAPAVALTRGQRSKPVCVRCWTMDGKCDIYTRCGTCRKVGAKCARKLCEDGDQCQSVHCPVLHPVQYNEDDPQWNVEDGKMPPKNKSVLPVRRTFHDLYRPGDKRRR